MKIILISISLCVSSLLCAQETRLTPEQIRSPAAPVLTLFAWQATTGTFVPLRVGVNLTINQSGGSWYLDAIAAAPTAPPERFKFVTTAGQTTFVVTTAGTVKDLWVYRNGILQASPGDYTTSADLKTVTAVVPATAGDLHQIFVVK